MASSERLTYIDSPSTDEESDLPPAKVVLMSSNNGKSVNRSASILEFLEELLCGCACNLPATVVPLAKSRKGIESAADPGSRQGIHTKRGNT